MTKQSLEKLFLSFAGGGLLAAALLPACTTTTTTTCATDANGNYVCADYVSAYPYDYAYVDPWYVSAGGYYPYAVDTYYDPYGYDYYLYTLAHLVADTATSGTDVPDLLDKAHRAANAINYGVRAALDPIKELIQTAPTETNNTITFGPADHASGNYRFTMRQLSLSEKRYAWKLEARPKSTSGTGDFSLVAGGTTKVGDADRRGTGVMGVDCDKLGAADSSITCRGQLLVGFSEPSGDKLLRVVLKKYTVDPTTAMPMDATVLAWRVDDNANHVRIVTHANLAGTATDAAEDIVIKLAFTKDTGARADAVATGGDIPSGQAIFINSCVGPSLAASDVMTTSRQCDKNGNGCTMLTGIAGGTLACPGGLGTADMPNPDPTADDPPAGAPTEPAAPSSVPDGNG
jgi:hypothetical protein